jgi:hypothetical protein
VFAPNLFAYRKRSDDTSVTSPVYTWDAGGR